MQQLTIDQIPAKLRNLPSWILWREQPVEGKKARKLPCKVGSWGPDDAHAPRNWSTCEHVLSHRNGHTGVGFSLAGADGILFLDLDKVRDPHTGEVKPWAQKFLSELNSYTETSPSGTGFHAFAFGSLPSGHQTEWNFADGSTLELYSTGRFATFTGLRVCELAAEVEERAEKILDLYTRAQRGEIGPVEPADETEAVLRDWDKKGLFPLLGGDAGY
jgi:primase-polymerase (primpol)-like protein